MLANFLDHSVSIADKFIKTICFIDDQPVFNNNEDPVNEDIDHRLNANTITKAFAPYGKSCSFYQYQKVNEESDVVSLANSSDVNVIDWRIFLSDEEVSSDENIVAEVIENADEEEEDVKEKEARGKYALRLIENIIQNNYDSPKLIIIYTAEYSMDSVFKPIEDKLKDLSIDFNSNADELWFQNDKLRISIFFKAIHKGKYLPQEVRNKIVEFASLPKIINIEFAKLTSGLVLGTALQCIAQVRSSTFMLLSSYNSNLDPAYLSHKALLPKSEDAEDHLIDIIGSDIKAILKESNIPNYLRNDITPSYLDYSFSEEKYPFSIVNSEQMPDISIPDEISKNTLHSIVINGIESTFLNNKQPFDQQTLFRKVCHKNLTSLFEKDNRTADMSNIKFAALTTIKPSYQLVSVTLTQGTILKEDSTNNFWLCLQPKCDSVRIETKKRAFIFVKLELGNENSFQIVIHDEIPIFLKINYKIYSSKLIDFYTDGKGNVTSIIDNGLVKFRKGDNLKMVWIAELKNDFSQSIANSFSTQLSRVGLDLSEWLRRNSNIGY